MLTGVNTGTRYKVHPSIFLWKKSFNITNSEKGNDKKKNYF